jgi:acyl-CoA synthetase (NDP forming)
VADSDLVVDALFRQTGVVRVDTIQELFDVAQVLAHQPLPPGRRVAIVANSGGPGVLAADACEAAGLEVPELAEVTQSALREALRPGAGVRNPVDLMPAAGAGDYDRALRLVLADTGVDAVIAVYTPPLPTGLDEVARSMAAVAAGAGRKPVVANFLGVEGIPEALRASSGTTPDGGRGIIPSFPFPESAARALARAAAYTEWRARPAGTVRRFDDVDAAGARAALQPALADHPQGTWLESAAAATVLSCYGIRLGPAGPGVDTTVGLRRDPVYGALAVFAMGNLGAELVGDRTIGVIPLTDRDATEMIHSLRSAPLLTGYRGSEPADLATLRELLLRVSQLAEQLPEVAELELKPVVASPSGATVVHARLRVAPFERHPELDLRRLR